VPGHGKEGENNSTDLIIRKFLWGANQCPCREERENADYSTGGVE
jgi:hypothetical protein